MKITTILRFTLPCVLSISIQFNSIAQEIELKVMEAIVTKNQDSLDTYLMILLPKEKGSQYLYYFPLYRYAEHCGYQYDTDDGSVNCFRNYNPKLFKKWLKFMEGNEPYDEYYDEESKTTIITYVIDDRAILFKMFANKEDSYLMITYSKLEPIE